MTAVFSNNNTCLQPAVPAPPHDSIHPSTGWSFSTVRAQKQRPLESAFRFVFFFFFSYDLTQNQTQAAGTQGSQTRHSTARSLSAIQIFKGPLLRRFSSNPVPLLHRRQTRKSRCTLKKMSPGTGVWPFVMSQRGTGLLSRKGRRRQTQRKSS